MNQKNDKSVIKKNTDSKENIDTNELNTDFNKYKNYFIKMNKEHKEKYGEECNFQKIFESIPNKVTSLNLTRKDLGLDEEAERFNRMILKNYVNLKVTRKDSGLDEKQDDLEVENNSPRIG